MRLLIHAVATIVVMALASPASATFYTYAEWAALSEYGRFMYISGLYDGLPSFVSHEDDMSMISHYRQCIANARMTNGQLAENIRVYASSRPNLQAKPVSSAFIAYLIQLCTMPPQPN
jgi:hypothetical protein